MSSNYEVKTNKGYCFYEVASAFQKSIRRGDEQQAMYWGIELYDSNYHNYAWKRMIIMASEDVGLGEPGCIVQVMALKQSFDFLAPKEKNSSAKLPFTHALLCLVRSRKSRYIDHAITVYWQTHGNYRIEIPDYALDNHTRRGKAMGRTLKYFYAEGVLINNANKLPGEEELERLAMEIDNVHGVSRFDDEGIVDNNPTPKKKGDDQQSLF